MDNETEKVIHANVLRMKELWDKIQILKEYDTLAAQVMYEKYKAIADRLPPPIPSHIIDDQAVS